MSYIGNEPSTTAFLTDTFNGTGAQLIFTMSVAPANTTSVLVAISGVVQDPSTYAVAGTTLTFSGPPPSGTGNISVRYLGIPASGVTNTAYRTVTDFTATAGQTSFTVPSYTVGYIDVYRNGVRLAAADYTASTGTTVVLASGCTLNDVVTTESFYVSSVLNAIPATANAINSTYLSPSLTLTTPAIASPVISGTPSGVGVLTSGTAQASTSGTNIDFTSIPSWVKRITVLFAGVSVNASSIIQVQLGTGSTTYTTTGYLGGGWFANTTNTNVTTGIPVIASGAGASARTLRGTMTIANITGNTWVASATIFDDNASGCLSGSSIALAAPLTAIRLTTVNGIDVFDAGTINILYE